MGVGSWALLNNLGNHSPSLSVDHGVRGIAVSQVLVPPSYLPAKTVIILQIKCLKKVMGIWNDSALVFFPCFPIHLMAVIFFVFGD